MKIDRNASGSKSRRASRSEFVFELVRGRIDTRTAPRPISVCADDQQDAGKPEQLPRSRQTVIDFGRSAR